MGMTVYAQLPVYEVDGRDAPLGDGPKLQVQSHWSKYGADGLVVIQMGNGETWTVAAGALRKAIDACTGVPRP